MNRHDPFTGFGDDTNTSVKFSIVADGGVLADWQGGPRVASFAIPNSAEEIDQYLGMAPWEAEFTLLFATVADLDLLDALQGTKQTLRYTAGVTRTAGGYHQTLGGSTYLVLPDTLLVGIGDSQIHTRAGMCRATATFKRTADTSAYYGFSTYAEDLP